MINKKTEKRIRLKKKIRTKIFGDLKKPRLSVFRSNQYIYAQMIDDLNRKTLLTVSDLKIKNGTKTERATKVGLDLYQQAKIKGIKTCIFDRNGFRYTGRIKALADSARKAGLLF